MKQVTQRLVNRLKAPATGNEIVYDGQVSGFGVRITAAGVIAFVLDYRFAGLKRRITIGRSPEWSADAARDEAIELRKLIRNGEDPLETRKEQREGLISEHTVADLAERYMQEHVIAHNSKDQQRNNRSMLDKDILPKLGSRRLSTITLSDIDRLHNWVNSARHEGKKKTPYRANRVHSLARSMFNKAIVWGWYEGRNPARAAKKDGTDGVIRFLENPREAGKLNYQRSNSRP